MNTAARFMSVFEGSEVAHGQTTVGKTSRLGKAEAKSFVVREPMTEERVQSHLNGGQGVGAIPINSKNMCRFGAIDVDDYDLNLQDVCARVWSAGLPLVVCRSKSGGAHIYLFLKDWEAASLVREYLTEAAALLGFAGREIFPKQDAVLHEKGDVGNFINLPYHNAERSMRYALGPQGEALTIEQFFEAVDNRRCALADLEAALESQRPEESELKEYPPCVQTLVALGGVSDSRNKFMMHTTVAIKKERPDDWEDAVDEFNRRYLNPPLSSSELSETVVKSHKRKEYGFLCNEPPMVNFCDKEKCRQCKFGIGGGGSPKFFPTLTGMTIMLSDPRMYYVNVDGQRLELTLEEMNSPRDFQKKCLQELNRRPDIMKDQEWGVLINGLLAEATEVEVRPELTTKGEFMELLEEFCTSQIRAMAPEEVMLNKPWTNNGTTSFKIQGLMEHLKRHDFKKLNRPQVQQIIKDLHDDPDKALANMRVRKEDGSYTSVRVWRVPEFESTDVDVGLESEDAQIEPPF
jgi:hypothetical protein